MDDLNLAQYRKILTLVVSGAIVFALLRFDLGLRDLSAFGFTLSGISEPLVDFLLTVGIPAAFTIAQPNEEGRSLLTYWRWIVGGLAVVAVLIVVAVVLAGAF